MVILRACEELSQLSRCRNAFIYFPYQRPVYFHIRWYISAIFRNVFRINHPLLRATGEAEFKIARRENHARARARTL